MINLNSLYSRGSISPPKLSHHRNEDGVSIVEYAIIVASLSIAATIILVVLGGQLEGSFSDLSTEFDRAMSTGEASGAGGGGGGDKNKND